MKEKLKISNKNLIHQAPSVNIYYFAGYMVVFEKKYHCMGYILWLGYSLVRVNFPRLSLSASLISSVSHFQEQQRLQECSVLDVLPD